MFFWWTEIFRVPCGKHLMVNSKIISLFVLKRLFNKNSSNSFLLCCDSFFHSAGKLYSSLELQDYQTTHIRVVFGQILHTWYLLSWFHIFYKYWKRVWKKTHRKNVKEKKKEPLFSFLFRIDLDSGKATRWI